MIFYAIVILLIILLREYTKKAEDYNQEVLRENFCCKIVFAFLVFGAAFHVPDVGSDADDYVNAFYQIKRFPIGAIFTDRAYGNYLGYYALSKVFSLMGMPVQVWLGFVEAFYLYAIMLLINRYSPDKLLSLLLFVTFGLFSFSVAGMKQTMGMGAMLYAFYFWTDKRIIPAIIFVAYGYFCHIAALAFLPAIMLIDFVNKKHFYLIIIAISILFITSYSSIFTSVIESTGQEKFYSYLEQDNRYSAVMLIYYLVMFAYSWLGYRKYSETNYAQSRLFMGMILLSIVLQIFATSYSFLFRLSLQYSIFYLFMIPNSLMMLDEQNKRLVTSPLIAITSFYCIYTGRIFEYHIGLL